MKIIFSFIILFITSLHVYGQKDSSATHPYIKFTCYPFLFSTHPFDGSTAVGPSVSVSGEKLEIQIGILFDARRYQEWNGNMNFINTTYTNYRNLYLLWLINYKIHLSKKISLFPSIGLIPKFSFEIPSTSFDNRYADYSENWGVGFAGVGISYKAANKIKLSMCLIAHLSYYEPIPGSLFEIAYRLN